MPNGPEADGYTRRKDLEERLMTFPSIAVLIFMLPGVLLMGFACFREWDFLLLFPDALLFITPFLVMKGFCAFYRFKCPQCRRRMKALLADCTRERFPAWDDGFSACTHILTNKATHGSGSWTASLPAITA